MNFDTFVSVCAGIGLATACGLRVFIPLLVVSVASHFGHLTLSPGFLWMGSTPALIAFSVAAAVEIVGYYIPWVDHVLDVLATPSAMIAGTIISVALMSSMDPFYKWALGVIAGGGMAGVMQGTTVVARGASTATTGGLGNPLLATAEWIGSIVLSVLALILPLLVILVLAVVFFFAARLLLKRKAISPVASSATAGRMKPT